MREEDGGFMLVDFLLKLNDTEKALLVDLLVVREELAALVDSCPKLEDDFILVSHVINVIQEDMIDGSQDCFKRAGEAAYRLKDYDAVPSERVSSILCATIRKISMSQWVWGELQKKWREYLLSKNPTGTVTTYVATEYDDIKSQVEDVNKCIKSYSYFYGRRDSDEIATANLALTSLVIELNERSGVDATKVYDGLEPLRGKVMSEVSSKSDGYKLNNAILKLYELLKVDDRVIQMEIEMKNEINKLNIDLM